MVASFYTAGQKVENPAKLSPAIKLAISDLQEIYPEQKIDALSWNDTYIAVPIEIDVDLPTRGSVGGIDIREREPIYLLFHRQNYPYQAPSVWSDRPNFPKGQLPHLNPTSPGMAANFCLHRGSINNWFAEHTIVDLVKRAQAWLRDAAADRLIRRDDGFEETRLPEILGYCIYEPSNLRSRIDQYWQQQDQNPGFAFLWYQLLNNTRKEPLIATEAYGIRLISTLQQDEVTDYCKLTLAINEHYKETDENQSGIQRMLFGVLAWPSQNRKSNRYFAELPNTLYGLIEWATNLGIPLQEALESYLANSLQFFGGIPITVIIPRPQRMIRSQSPLEILNFVLSASGDHSPTESSWNLDAQVFSLGHRAPLTLRRAREISSFSPDEDMGRLLFLGCGAVGSKLILHLAKSGQGRMTLVDYDELSPHNLVRHGLLSQSLGLNKAEALQQSIKGVYYGDGEVDINPCKFSALDILLKDQNGLLKNHSWLIDTTASPMVLNALCQSALLENISCCRCEIADEGHLGLLSVEGANRNPRLDDVQLVLFDLAINNPNISHWLKSNQKQREETVGSTLEDIYIGISCSSETMRIADEVVSIHASSFATGFRKSLRQRQTLSMGSLQISCFDETKELSAFTRNLEIKPVIKLMGRNDSSWEVRLKSGLDEGMKQLLLQAKPNETGGILIGLVNIKRKIVYVSRILPAPPDSRSSPYAFIRGIQDIPDQVIKIQNLTGGMLGYVGEWHTHPNGGPDLSDKDMDTVRKIQKTLAGIQLPTHILVVTNRGLYPHIFSPI